jgi:hypothetical protein
MARSKPAAKKPTKKAGGPYLAAAFFCESVIEDKQDSALTAIRIVDTIMFQLHPSAPADFPSETQRLPVPISGLLMFKTGDSPGEHTVRLVAESPSGKKHTILEQVVTFTQPPHGGSQHSPESGHPGQTRRLILDSRFPGRKTSHSHAPHDFSPTSGGGTEPAV